MITRQTAIPVDSRRRLRVVFSWPLKAFQPVDRQAQARMFFAAIAHDREVYAKRLRLVRSWHRQSRAKAAAR